MILGRGNIWLPQTLRLPIGPVCAHVFTRALQSIPDLSAEARTYLIKALLIYSGSTQAEMIIINDCFYCHTLPAYSVI